MARRLKGLEATRLFRKLVPDLRWCDECGVPIIGMEKCPRCGSTLRKVKVVPPGDVRPAFEKDKRMLREVIERYIGREAAKKLIDDRDFILLNKVQAIDSADEVIVSGYSIGIREFDIYRMEWIFKPSYIGAKLVVDEKLGFYAIVARDDLKPFTTISRGEVIEGDIPPVGYWISIASRDQRVYGVAKVLERGDLRIHKVWRALPREIEFKHIPADMKKVIEANRIRLEALEQDAIAFLNKVKKLATPVVNVSGGKDSTVTAYLAAEAGIRNAMFIDTGLEFPETIDTIYKVVDELDLDLTMPSAGDAFWRAVEVFGPPARDYRWCCKVCKLAPLARYIKPKFGKMLNIVGQRQYESTSRALAGRLARSGSTAGDYIAAPIQRWTSLDVFMFIEEKKLPLNPLYRLGYERIGCFMCPTSRLAEMKAVEDTHRDLWNRWYGVLERFARKLKLPREWIDYGLWRWRFEYPAEIQYLIRKLGLKPAEILDREALNYVSLAQEFDPSYKLCVSLFVDVERLDIEKVKRALVAVDLTPEEGKGFVLAKAKKGIARIYTSGKIEICANEYDYLERLVKRVLSVINMVRQCLGCLLCAYTCPYGAIRAGSVDVSKCRRCAKCMAVCPSAAQLTKHAIYMLRRVMGIKETGKGLADRSV